MEYPFPVNELRLSHSSRKVLNSCDRKFEFSKFFKHVKRDRSLPGDVGHALHAGYQEWLLSKDKDKAIFEMMLKYPQDLFAEYPQDPRTMEACYATMEALMSAHSLQKYELVYIKCLDGVRRPAIEVPFEIKLPGLFLDGPGEKIPTRFVGVIDIVVFDNEEQKFKVIDIKSHRKFSQGRGVAARDLTPIYQFDEQCLPYALVIQQAIGKVITNFSVTYLAAYVDVNQPIVQVYTFPKGKNDVYDWARGLLVDVNRLQRFYQSDWFPRTGGNKETCYAFNRYKCKFFDVCAVRDKAAIQYTFLQGEIPEPDEFIPWLSVELELAA